MQGRRDRLRLELAPQRRGQLAQCIGLAPGHDERNLGHQSIVSTSAPRWTPAASLSPVSGDLASTKLDAPDRFVPEQGQGQLIEVGSRSPAICGQRRRPRAV